MKDDIGEIIRRLKKHYPEAKTTLSHRSPYELLMSTILSAQTTDKAVNQVTPELFKRYPSAEKMARARRSSIEKIIKSLGFFRNKAKSLKNCSKMLVEEFGGEVPKSIDEMTRLPGVGRKTANVVLGNAFGIDEGIVVDTHVGRISRRLGLTSEENAGKAELDLMDVVPKRDWTVFSHLLIAHGRSTCMSRKPLCSECFLDDVCPKIGVENR